MRARQSIDKAELTPEQAAIVRALEPHADTIRKWLWAVVSIIWAAAIIGIVGVVLLWGSQ